MIKGDTAFGSADVRLRNTQADSKSQLRRNVVAFNDLECKTMRSPNNANIGKLVTVTVIKRPRLVRSIKNGTEQLFRHFCKCANMLGESFD